MMRILLLLIFIITTNRVCAQQPLNAKGITYLLAPKQNNMVYNDSIFRGSKEFKHLFFRTGNAELLGLYKKHQSNKIWGQAMGFVGTVGVLVGINYLSGSEKGFGWAMIGAGFLGSVSGGYFTLISQRHLSAAIHLFNQRYGRNALGVGVGDKSVGLVYKF